MYHYLTGAASWFMMTMITEVYGVRGKSGDLVLHPKLIGEQFDADNTASVSVPFAGRSFQIVYTNADRKDYGEYTVSSADCNGTKLTVIDNSYVLIPFETLTSLTDTLHRITVTLT